MAFLSTVCGRAMRAPTMLRKKVTAHYAAMPVGARIARPRFMQNLLCCKELTGNGVYGIISSVCEAAGRPRAERCEESPSSAGQSAG